MTETSAGSFVQFLDEHSSGNCGGPVANVKYKLRSIPEMGYDAQGTPPRGEILVAGSSVMPGYFCNPDKTSEMMPDGKWLLTGDVAEVLPNGSIKIVDRAKNIFKLSQGEYIAPEKLENVFIQSSWIDQVWVHGDSLHDFVILFAVLNPQEVQAKWGDKPDLKDSKHIGEVMKSVYELANHNKFNSLEKPKQFFLTMDPFSVENDMLTPTMKLKRNIAAKKFVDEIKALYDAGPFKQ